MSPRPNDPDTEALLSAFLDGELSAAEEQDVIRLLEQHPELQDTLDDLAQGIALTQRALTAENLDGDIHSAVLAQLDAHHIPADDDGAFTLANLVHDGEANSAQLSRLVDFSSANDNAAMIGNTLAAAEAVAAGAVAPGESKQAAATLSRMPDAVLARVERTERGYALALGMADGELSDAEANELCGLVGADVDLLDTLDASVVAHPHTAAIGEALTAFTGSSVVHRLASRAGDAALQAIAATKHAQTAHEKPAQQVQRVSVWASLRAIFSQGFVPLGAASAAAVMFFAIGNSQVTTGPAGPGTGVAHVDVGGALFQVLEPVVLANNTTLDTPALPIIGDNDADVEAIDATGTTMVFQTAASNITVIWLAGLDDDEGGEQGT